MIGLTKWLKSQKFNEIQYAKSFKKELKLVFKMIIQIPPFILVWGWGYFFRLLNNKYKNSKNGVS